MNQSPSAEKLALSEQLLSRIGHDRPSFRSCYALQGPDTAVPLPAWVAEGDEVEWKARLAGRARTAPGSRRHLRRTLSPPALGFRPSSPEDANTLMSPKQALPRAQSAASLRSVASAASLPTPPRAATAPPRARWWLFEPKTGRQSLGKGLFEITTGILVLRCEPKTEADTVGSLRSGTRFLATPRLVNGTAWLEVQTRGAPPPLFSLDDADRGQGTAGPRSNHLTTRFYKESCRTPIVRPEVGANESAWVEYNKQYIERIRDIGREKGEKNFSTLDRSTQMPKLSLKEWSRYQPRASRGERGKVTYSPHSSG